MDGPELRRRRGALKLSQAKLAVLLGVPRITVYRWEKDGAIKHGTMLRLALDRLEQEREPRALLKGEGDGA